MRICDVVGGIGLLKILFAGLLWEGGIRCNDFSIIGQCFALQQKFTLARKLKVILLYQPLQNRTIPPAFRNANIYMHDTLSNLHYPIRFS